MHSLCFLLKHLLFLFILSFSLVQCKSKKKFQSDKKARLVDPSIPSSPQSVKDVHRPVSQAPPTMVPLGSPKIGIDDDTLAGVPTIHPDLSKGAPPAN